MPKTSAPPGRKPIDPRSAETVLFFADNGFPMPRGIPARDLHGGDLARIARVRALEAGIERPALATADELEELATELSGLGLFTREGATIEGEPIAVEEIVEADEPAGSEI